MKSGRTAAGLRAATSHTAGLAASELAVDGLFQQAGVIRADTIDEMFDVAACLDSQPLPPGRRVAIVTNAGGPGILAADACVAGGLDVPPTAAGMTNPIDLIASAAGSAYEATIAALLAADDVDAVLAIYTTIESARTPEMLSAITKGVVEGRKGGFTDKPVVVCTMAVAEYGPAACGHGDRAGIRVPGTSRKGARESRSVCSVASGPSWVARIAQRRAVARSASVVPRHRPNARQFVADAAGTAAAASCRRSPHGAVGDCALCRRSGSPRARLRLPRRRQARIAQSGPQDRSRWCPAASRQRARGAHGVRRTVRHRQLRSSAATSKACSFSRW